MAAVTSDIPPRLPLDGIAHLPLHGVLEGRTPLSLPSDVIDLGRT
jgi:hypothetical protein